MPLSKIQGIEGQVTPNLGRRNLIINGAMQVAQRGTSATGVGTAVSYNTVDRFRFADAGSPTARFTETQDSSGPVGFSNSIKFEVTTADTSVAATTHQYIDQFIEAQNLQHLAWGTSSGKKIVLSFYVKCSTAQTFAVDFVNEDNSKYFNTTYTVNAANTWERKIIVLPADTASGFNDDNGRGLRCRWTLVAGTDYTDGSVDTTWQSSSDRATNHQNTWVGATGRTWAMTGAQLEVGDTSTDFEHRSFAEEHQLCRRYFQKTYPYDAYLGSNSDVACVNYLAISAADEHNFNFPVIMRGTPTMSLMRKNGGAANEAQRTNNAATYANIATSTIRDVGFDISNDATNSAVYRFHYYADAEL